MFRTSLPLPLVTLFARTPATTDGTGTTGEISTNPYDLAHEIATLQAQIADIQSTSDATEARLADAEAHLADADTGLRDM